MKLVPRFALSLLVALGLALGIAAPVMAQSSGAVFTPLTPRNLLDNPRSDIYQRGTAPVLVSSSILPTYHDDRWAEFTASASQNISMTNLTTGLPTGQGFANAEQFGRSSGSNTTTICRAQEIQTSDVIALQGQAVTFSAWLQAGAGLNVAASNSISALISAGTGTDQGLVTLSSVAVTPNSWTGAANPLNQTQVITTTWTRYAFGPVTVPATATELAVQICYTPAGSFQTGETINVVGEQLEQSPAMTAFEQRPIQWELDRVQRYFQCPVQENGPHGTATALMFGDGPNTSTTAANIWVPFIEQMRVAPSAAVSTLGS